MTKTKTAKKPAATKSTRAKKTPASGKATAKKTSALDAAAKLLAASREPMTTKEMIDALAAKGIWKSPGGKTPDRTLYSAILREIGTKGKDARFKKTERGKFTSAGK
jgi:hypothetical protein